MVSNPCRNGVGIARSLVVQPPKRSLHIRRVGIDKPPPVGIDTSGKVLGAVPTYDGNVDLETFRRLAFNPQKPIRITKEASDGFVPAFKKWFQPVNSGPVEHMGPTPYLSEHAPANVPYELLLPAQAPPNPISAFIEWLSASPDPDKPPLAAVLFHELANVPPRVRFTRFNAPLGLFIAGLEYNQQAPEHERLGDLYIAQAPLDTLPQPLQDDLPAPDLVTQAGTGDIYNSSLWMGLQPTYTPWHQDPNPNLFYQLHGTKMVRLLPPRRGTNLFNQVKSRVGGDQSGPSSSKIRGEEMMEEGEEKQALYDSVWGNFAPGEMWSIRVRRGNALFIPKGWWHSFRSEGTLGHLNASVNWWFR